MFTDIAGIQIAVPSPGTEFDCFIHITLFISRLAKKFNQFLVAIFAFASIWMPWNQIVNLFMLALVPSILTGN